MGLLNGFVLVTISQTMKANKTARRKKNKIYVIKKTKMVVTVKIITTADLRVSLMMNKSKINTTKM
jgi:hypothetical protein